MSKIINKTFYFMRHGTTGHNLSGICQGQFDTPLHEIGIKEAHDSIITNQEITHVFYSPLKRAAETAKIVTQFIDCPKIELSDIQEWHFGELQDKKWPFKKEEWFEIFATYQPVGGENFIQFSQRIVRGINFGLAQSECPLFVSHSGVIRALLYHFKLDHFLVENCELIKFVPGISEFDGWSIVRYKKDFE